MTFEEIPTRRHFLVLSGTGLAALLVGCAKDATANKTNASLAGTPDGSGADTAGGGSDTTASGDCTVTDPDVPGPFYVEGVPVRNDLDLYGHAGTKLMLSGLVLDANCNPIPNAIVDIWHAYPTTVNAADLTRADSVDYDNTSAEMHYRGQTATDADGRYSFQTKKPGWYLNGNRFRPTHIHVKVWVNGTERLTTQLYFKGDPYIEGDPWASDARALDLVNNEDGSESGSFDFVLA